MGDKMDTIQLITQCNLLDSELSNSQISHSYTATSLGSLFVLSIETAFVIESFTQTDK